jgi:hypothetical protein
MKMNSLLVACLVLLAPVAASLNFQHWKLSYYNIPNIGTD